MTYIYWANDYVSDKTNFNLNESILPEKPAKSDFNGSVEFVYIFLKSLSDFIDFYGN